MDRTVMLQAVRAAIAATILSTAWSSDDVTQPLWLTFVVLVHLGTTIAVEVARRIRQWPGTRFVQSLLLFDSLVLALAIDLTGRDDSPVLFVVSLHVTAATVLVSYRMGLKVALWQGALLFLASSIAMAGGSTAGTEIDTQALSIAVVGFLAVAIGAAAFTSLNERVLDRRRADLRSLAETGAVLSEARSVDEVLAGLAKALQEHLDFAEVLVGTGSGDRWIGAVAGANDRTFDLDGPPDPIVEQVHRQWTAVAQLGDGDAPRLCGLLSSPESVVLLCDDLGLGVHAALQGHGPSAPLHVETIETAIAAVSRAALTIDHLLLVAEIERLATTDSLTGLASRRVFDEALLRRVAESCRTQQPITLLFIDVDHFKQVNDVHGHARGDDVLRIVGRALLDTCRDGDLVARFGGEELVALLPNVRGTEARQIAERVRAVVLERSTALGIPVTASVGIASCPDHATTSERLLRMADAALYRAKERGRDQVCLARSLGRRQRQLTASGS